MIQLLFADLAPHVPEGPRPGQVAPAPPLRAQASLQVAHGPVFRLLVVDDEPDILQTIADLLPAFFQGALAIETATSAEEAQERLAAGVQYDAIISDHRMPGQQGLEFLHQVRAREPRCVRVLMTAYQDRALRHRALEDHEVDLFVAKPFDLADFADRLGMLLDARAGAVAKVA